MREREIRSFHSYVDTHPHTDTCLSAHTQNKTAEWELSVGCKGPVREEKDGERRVEGKIRVKRSGYILIKSHKIHSFSINTPGEI